MKQFFCKVMFFITAAGMFGQTVGSTNMNSLQNYLYQQDNSTVESSAADSSDTLDLSGKIISPQTAMANPDYKVTAGDIYSLNYAAGTTAVSYKIIVDSTYKIRVSNLAVLDVSDMTFVTLKKQVEDIVTKNYPLSGVQFVLTVPAVFNVVVLGEVKETTEVAAWSLTRLSEILEPLLTKYSSIRNVTITSNTGKQQTYDLFQAVRFGTMVQDPYLRPGDVVTVNRADRKVSILGAVERPGIYELLENENLQELINYYGNGLEIQADSSRIELTRITEIQNNSGEKIYLSEKDINNNYQLQAFDTVYIPSFAVLKPVVFVEGAVSTDAGTVLEASTRLSIQFNYGENYSFFIKNNENWFTSTSDIENAYVLRGSEIIPLDISRILYDSSYYSEIKIEPNDILRIPFKQYFVSVTGSVFAPGRYPYIPDRTYDYYIGLAGGIIRSQNSGNAVTILDMDGKELSKNDIITPECIINAKTNSFTYYFNQYAPVVTTFLSLIVTSLTIWNAVK